MPLPIDYFRGMGGVKTLEQKLSKPTGFNINHKNVVLDHELWWFNPRKTNGHNIHWSCLTVIDPKRTVRTKKDRQKTVFLYAPFGKPVIAQKALDHQAYVASY